MVEDRENAFRPLLDEDPPAFADKVNTPWDRVPDVQGYNQPAYNRIVRALRVLERERVDGRRDGVSTANTQGVLVLGEAGTGKTHLLMRVANNLGGANHILFVNRPTDRHTVTQHIWLNVVNSLARTLPASGSPRSQLDDLLAHVFRDILVPEFERDIAEGRDADRRRRWVDRLQHDPFALFTMIGDADGPQRQRNLELIRNRTLNHLRVHHPEVDPHIARALITYCLVGSENRRRAFLDWLRGRELEADEANDLGLPAAWVAVDESADNSSVQQQREAWALRAVCSVAVLSTHYQPLVLAFDQLEGLRGNEPLTLAWGDAVREVFTHAPNVLVITCIFPSLWNEWFEPLFARRTDWRSVQERFAQQRIDLEAFAATHAQALLAGRLKPSYDRHGLPTPIYPFEEADVRVLAGRAASPREFLRLANEAFQRWLDGTPPPPDAAPAPAVVTREAIDQTVRAALLEAEAEFRAERGGQVQDGQDLFGRVRNVLETVLGFSGERVTFADPTCGGKVMPPAVVLRDGGAAPAVAFAVGNGEGNTLTAWARNLVAVVREGRQCRRAVFVRDRRCKPPGKGAADQLAELEKLGGVYLQVGPDELAVLNAVYDTLVAVEERDLTVGKHPVDRAEFVQQLRLGEFARRSQLLRTLAVQFPPLERALGLSATAVSPPPPTPLPAVDAAVPPQTASPPTPARPIPVTPPRPRPLAPDVLVGSKTLTDTEWGLVGTLKHDRRRVAVGFGKPMCAVLLGYMGSGKSYALGVLVENALLGAPNVTANDRPLAVVAFNYRPNPEARFEYAGFARPNAEPTEVERLRREYGGEPQGVRRVTVLGYGPELARRRAEYAGLPTLPIAFRPTELTADHWQILMKPPNERAEYMQVVRDVIATLHYAGRLSLKTLEHALLTDERLAPAQRRLAKTRLSFAEKWVADDRPYEWADVLAAGTLTVVDLRMQTLPKEDALKLCLVLTDVVRRTKNGVNKVVVYDEAHEYLDAKGLAGELERAITQMRHDGVSFVLAAQDPKRIPEGVFKYLLTRLVFKLTDKKGIDLLRKSVPNLEGLSAQQVANLSLEEGECVVQTDDDCTDPVLKVPQLMRVRPRCSQHGGATVRNTPSAGGE